MDRVSFLSYIFLINFHQFMSLEQYCGYKISKFYCCLCFVYKHNDYCFHIFSHLHSLSVILVLNILSLQSILGQYIRADWLQYSSHSWVERCQSTNSAESVELLKEVSHNFCYNFMYLKKSFYLFCLIFDAISISLLINSDNRKWIG